jgi:hypothetical protein
MSPVKSDFRNLTPLPEGKINIRGVGGTIPATATGEIHTTTWTRDHELVNVILKDALYVPKLGVRLMSVNAAIHQGLGKFVFDKHEGDVVCNDEKRIPLFKSDDMYFLSELHTRTQGMPPPSSPPGTFIAAPVAMPVACISAIAMHNLNSAEQKLMWHRRLGHLSDVPLNSALRDMNVHPSVLNAVLPHCEPCALSKARQFPYKKREGKRSTNAFELVHSDVWGPLKTPSHNGATYMVIFVDDWTSMVWCYSMMSTSELPDRIHDFLDAVRHPGGNKIKKFQGDGTYKHVQKIANLLNSYGIDLQVSAAYSQGQNGVAERKLQTIATRTLSMMVTGRQPRYMWALAWSYVIHIMNRTSTSANGGVAPISLWNPGEITDLAKLRTFGCPCYIHIPDAQRNKFEMTAYKGIFVGICPFTRAFLIFKAKKHANGHHGRVLDARSVTFDETVPHHKAPARSLVTLFDDFLNMRDTLIPDPNEPATGDAPVDSVDVVDSDDDTTSEKSEQEPPRQIAPEIPSDDDDVPGDNPSNNFPPPPTRSGSPSRFVVSSDRPQASGGEVYLDDDEVMSPAAPHPRRSRRTNILHNMDQDYEYDFHVKADMQYLDGWVVTFNVGPDGYMNGQDWHASYKNAMAGPHGPQWNAAAMKELKAHADRGTWQYVPAANLPPNANVITCRWVWKVKYANVQGKESLFKARLVARGFQQREGIDYNEVFAPTVSYTSVKILLALTATNGWHLIGIDVNTAFLYAEMKEEVYMRHPEGLDVPCDERGNPMVLRLMRSLYGTKQANRNWSQLLTKTLLEFGLIQSQSDQGMYFIRKGENLALLSAFVDDMFIGSSSKMLAEGIVKFLKSKFEIKELGDLSLALGMEIKRDLAAKTLTVTQVSYIDTLLQRFGMADCHPAAANAAPCDGSFDSVPPSNSPPADIKLYQQLVGSLMYLVTCCRTDIAYYVCKLSRKLTAPTERDLQYGLQILKYLKSTREFGLQFGGHGYPVNQVVCYADANYGGVETFNGIKRRSTTGFCLTLNGATVMSSSRLQPVVAQSTAEAEYYALGSAAQGTMFVRNFLDEIGFKQKPTVAYEDNVACRLIATSEVCASKTKHIEIRYHAVRELVQKGYIVIKQIQTKDQIADGLTKALKGPTHASFALAVLGLSRPHAGGLHGDAQAMPGGEALRRENHDDAPRGLRDHRGLRGQRGGGNDCYQRSGSLPPSPAKASGKNGKSH